MIRKNARMSKIEKRRAKELNRAKKSAKTIKRKLATTLSWMDVADVLDGKIILKRDKKKMIIKGVKLSPHDIFIEDIPEQIRLIDRLRMGLNAAPNEMWFSFVYAPVQIDQHLNNLDDAAENETDPVCHAMIEADREKAEWFISNYSELEFFVLVRDVDEERLDKKMADLIAGMRQGSMFPQILTDRDYYNYLSFVFENPTINDYVFTRGIFSYLNQNFVWNEEKEQWEEKDTTENFEKYGDPIPNIAPDWNEVKRSKIAPVSLGIHADYMNVGDKYVSNLLVTSIPQLFSLGLFCRLITDKQIKMYISINKLNVSTSVMLRKEYNEKERELRKTTDPSYRQRLMNELSSLDDYIRDVQAKNDRTHNITVVMSITADSVEELKQLKRDFKEKMRGLGLYLMDGRFLQEQLFRLMTPLFIHVNMEPIVRENIGIPLTSDAFAGLYPFVFETMKDRNGFLLGTELNQGGIVLNDPFYYRNQAEQSRENKRINGNIVVVGGSGMGKTTAMNLYIRHFIMKKIKLLWIDPENKNRALATKYGGVFIDWGAAGNVINAFELKPNDVDDSDPDWETKFWDTELAIKRVIIKVDTILRLLFPELDPLTESCTGTITLMAFKKVGIARGADGKYPEFRHRKENEYPTFSTFHECLLEAIQLYHNESAHQKELQILTELELYLRQIVKGTNGKYADYFDGYTTVAMKKTGRKIMAFGTKNLFNAETRLQAALYYIMFNYAWAECLDVKEYSAFIIDEAHTMILKDKTSELVSQFYRRSRKYQNVMLLGTQQPQDFADPKVITDGMAIFSNSAYKLILGLNKGAVDGLRELETLNAAEYVLIQNFQQGQALLLAGSNRIAINVIATQSELEDMRGGSDF